ncbi:hypothetical protein ACJW31_07G034600 [Castanea mollissima]
MPVTFRSPLKLGRYIGVGDNETAQTFYYFIESQRSPARDPLMLWMTGGPGCSSITGFMFESEQ